MKTHLSAVLATAFVACLNGSLLLFSTVPANAQARAWVASNGSGNTCSRASPCATFQTAHNALPPSGGEINCVDSGDFSFSDTVTLSKSVTIDCGGTFGSHSFSNIHISGNNIVVKLRNVSLHGGGTAVDQGSVAINFINGAELHVENCSISGYQGTGGAGTGILFTPPANVAAKLFVSNSTISNNGTASQGGGIVIKPTGNGTARVTVDSVKVHDNRTGLIVDGSTSIGGIHVTAINSTFSGNFQRGVTASTISTGAPILIMLDRVTAAYNGTGVASLGSKSNVRIANSTITGNLVGVQSLHNGVMRSYKNNQIINNTTDGTPLAALALE